MALHHRQPYVYRYPWLLQCSKCLRYFAMPCSKNWQPGLKLSFSEPLSPVSVIAQSHLRYFYPQSRQAELKKISLWKNNTVSAKVLPFPCSPLLASLRTNHFSSGTWRNTGHISFKHVFQKGAENRSVAGGSGGEVLPTLRQGNRLRRRVGLLIRFA